MRRQLTWPFARLGRAGPVFRTAIPPPQVRQTMKYVLMFVETEQFAKELEAMGPQEREEAYAKVAR
ncbi:hypothetical protein ACIBQX_42320 [Nonomuraea sp. NPDC049714]|uniref:hypothetical protein n=1 Tax=Nonomuraea sp. NPDC049714 TaxID=3364357 RepID=UPI0037AD1C6F